MPRRRPMHHGVTDRWLRQELSDLRESKHLSRAQAAKLAVLDVRTVERIERGPDPVSAQSMSKLLHAYHPVRPALRQQLWQMRDLAYLPGWWDAWHDIDLWPSHAEHCELEEIADSIDMFAPTIVHGLVQSPEYAEYVQTVSPSPAHRQGWHADRLVELRLARQQRFRDLPRRNVRVLLDEVLFSGARRGPVAEQTRHLLDLEKQGLLEARFLPLTQQLIVPDVFTLFTVGRRHTVCLGASVDHHVEDDHTVTVVRHQFEQAWHVARPLASRKD